MSAGKKAESLGIDVTIMGREYRVACKPDEERDLRAAVAYVDQQMRDIRDAMRQNNAERVAVMAALNIANELLRTRSNPTQASTRTDTGDIDLDDLKLRIQSMQSTIDTTLAEQERLL